MSDVPEAGLGTPPGPTPDASPDVSPGSPGSLGSLGSPGGASGANPGVVPGVPEDGSARGVASVWSARAWSRFLLMILATVFASAVYVNGGHPAWAVALVLCLAVLTGVLGVTTRFMADDREGHWAAAFGVLTALVLGLEAWAGPEWAVTAAWATSAAGWSRSRHRKPLIGGVSAATGLLVLSHGADVGQAVVFAAFVLLAGVFSAQARRSSELIDELRSTRRELARLAVLEERNRIARDLHDLVGHSLSVVAVKTELARRLLSLDTDRADAELKDIDATVRRALAEVRQAVTSYRQPTLAAELSSAVRAAEAAGIACEVRAPETWDLPVPVEGLLAWTVREGITNVLRHSGASSCVITVSPVAPVSVEIADDGSGPPEGEGRGNGLAGLSERARALGGTLTVGRRDGGGFLLRVEAPKEAR
ncbi:sensor histidine kinase [Microtetraspora niveoalba]|uniref:sensor histidine kinase n=1 Tax=Microtetraspora niveoalba TaxID=46175 RepID=UPI000AB0762F|nr:sensor histidine kinase [Microtetraspora niveoalba]